MMRIGFNSRCLEEPEMRGLARYTTNLLKELSRRKDIELVLFSRRAPWPEHLAGVNARVVACDGLRETIWNDYWLPRQLQTERIDLFHAPADRGLPFPKPCPLVVTVHDSYERAHWPQIFTTMKGRLWYWKHEYLNYARSDAVLTVSETTKKDLVRLRVAPRHKLHAIHLAPAPEFSTAASTADDARILQKYKIPRQYLLYVGGYDGRKNTDALVRAFDRAALPGHSLVIIGAKKHNYADLARRWATLSCSSRLYSIEAETAEIPTFYRHAELFVNPSKWESFSFQMLEAMCCGTPILSSNRQALPEIAQDAAVYFDPDDIDELASLMRRTQQDRPARERLRRQGISRAKEFSWCQTADQTIGIYRDILERNRSVK